MTIERIGNKYCVVNSLGLIVETFKTLEEARKFLKYEPA
jgi:hypothetical protein